MIFTRLRREALPIHTNSDATPAVQNTLAPRQCPAFPLLKLPAELRNLVYYHFLASEDGIITITEGNIKARAPILLTCRQVRGEAYYTLSRYFRFRIECGFGDGVRAARWLGTLGSKPRVYEIIIDLAADLRYHFASSHGHAVLQRVSSRAVSFTRQRKYDKRYKKVLSDHDAIHGYMTEGMNAPYSKGSIGRQLCAPPHCVQLRLDEWRYLDRITNALRNRGYEIKDE